MRGFLAVMAVLLTLGMPGARAETPEAEIARVIGDQIAAFGQGDVAAAWEHASPTIQGIFKTPERFGEMVREGYPMVWRPSHWEMRELTQRGGGFIQSVLFQDAAGQLWIADYDMRLIDGVWRINGVTLREAPGVGI